MLALKSIEINKMDKQEKSLSIIRNELIAELKVDLTDEEQEFEVIESVKEEGYTQQLIKYNGWEGDSISAYLLIPDGEGKFPTVLVHHQHNSQFHWGKSEVCGIVGDPFNAFGIALVKKGIMVMAPDSVGFEDRRRNVAGTKEVEETDWRQYFNGMAYRLVKGNLLISTVINDALIAVNILCKHSKVNIDSIGVMGHSYGGNTTLFHAAIDDRIKFACASGAACSYRNKMENETGLEMSLIIPGFLNKFDIEDLVVLSTPKEMLLVAATDDKYSKNANEIAQCAHETLKALQKEDNIELKEYNGTHALTKERFDYIISWIVKKSFSKLFY